MPNLKYFKLITAILVIAGNLFIPINPTQADSKLRIAIVYDSGGKGDAGINDLTYSGLIRVMKKLKISTFDVKEQIFDPNTAGDRFTRVRFLARNGYQLIIGVGAGFAPALNQIAMEFPKTQFAIIDSEKVALANVTALSFDRNQGLFVAGAALALASKTGKVCFFADAKNTYAQADLSLLGKGAKYAKATTQIIAKISDDPKSSITELLKQDCDQIFSTWDNDDQVIRQVALSNDVLPKNATKVRVSGILPDQFFLNLAAGADLPYKNNPRYLTIKKRTDIAVEQLITSAYSDRSMKEILPGAPGVYGKRYNLSNGGLQIDYVGPITNASRLSTITSAVRTGKIKLDLATS